MGAVLAKFRKEKTTSEILEKLETNIKEIEEYSISTQARQRRFVGNFLVISIGLYVIGFLIFYFLFFPPTWMERITYSVPLLIFPLLIFLLRRLLAWSFQRKLNQNSSKLFDLRAEKKKVLEQVMDKETYKVALELLNRYGDKSPLPAGPKLNVIPSTPRQMVATPSPQNSPALKGPMAPANIPPNLPAPGNEIRMRRTSPGTPGPRGPPPQQFMHLTPSFMHRSQMQRIRTPFPIINQHGKGMLEKMVDYLIGDGPQNRFAMICKECFGHNGMVLQEEYEYAAFRCAFCNSLNPSRKSRPIAPKLPVVASASPMHAVPAQLAKRKLDSSESEESDPGERNTTDQSDAETASKSNQEESNPTEPTTEEGSNLQEIEPMETDLAEETASADKKDD